MYIYIYKISGHHALANLQKKTNNLQFLEGDLNYSIFGSLVNIFQRINSTIH